MPDVQALTFIPLPLPVDDRNPSIFPAIDRRDHQRAVRVTPLPPQLLSNLLWSAWGANRRRAGSTSGRSATAGGSNPDIDLFVVYEKAAYHYNARANHLLPVSANESGVKAEPVVADRVAANAAVQLVYVASLPSAHPLCGSDDLQLPDPQLTGGHYCADTGSLAGKIYLFASAHGISASPCSCDRSGMARRLGLQGGQRVLFAQAVHYPRQAVAARSS